MHLTREALDVWAAAKNPTRSNPSNYNGMTIIRLEEGDTMAHRPDPDWPDTYITGPAIVELVVYRDGGWSAREMVYETPESIALAASLAQRQQLHITEDGARLRRIMGYDPIPERRDWDNRGTLHLNAQRQGDCEYVEQGRSCPTGEHTYTWQSQTLPVPPEHRQ